MNKLKLGIDISEWNENIDWTGVLKKGVQFIIPRLGWGKGHLDSKVFEHVANALILGLDLGVYFYSYALDKKSAENEARMAYELLEWLKDETGNPDLPLGFFLDMEDGDFYKENYGVESREQITGITEAFLNEMNRLTGETTGIYASRDWLDNKIDLDHLPPNTPIWCAHWADQIPEDAHIWQFTDKLDVGGQEVDGNYLL